MGSWQELIDHAARQGYYVRQLEEGEGFVVVTPKGFRRPSQELGTFKDERAAWRSAAHLAYRETAVSLE